MEGSTLKTNEIAGTGNHNTALFWEYDTRLGRRWNVDPKPHVGVSGYSTFGGNPIFNIDPNGDYFFGLIGSTSDQRKATREHAKQTGGDVKSIVSRTDIRVSYRGKPVIASGSEAGITIGAKKNVYFDEDGNMRDKSYSHMTLDGLDDYSPNITFSGGLSAGGAVGLELEGVGVSASKTEVPVVGIKDFNPFSFRPDQVEYFGRNAAGDKNIQRSGVGLSLIVGKSTETTKKINSDGVKQKAISNTIFTIGVGLLSYKVVQDTDPQTGKSQTHHGIAIGAKIAMGLGLGIETYFKFGGYNSKE